MTKWVGDKFGILVTDSLFHRHILKLSPTSKTFHNINKAMGPVRFWSNFQRLCRSFSFYNLWQTDLGQDSWLRSVWNFIVIYITSRFYLFKDSRANNRHGDNLDVNWCQCGAITCFKFKVSQWFSLWIFEMNQKQIKNLY